MILQAVLALEHDDRGLDAVAAEAQDALLGRVLVGGMAPGRFRQASATGGR